MLARVSMNWGNWTPAKLSILHLLCIMCLVWSWTWVEQVGLWTPLPGAEFSGVVCEWWLVREPEHSYKVRLEATVSKLTLYYESWSCFLRGHDEGRCGEKGFKSEKTWEVLCQLFQVSAWLDFVMRSEAKMKWARRIIIWMQGKETYQNPGSPQLLKRSRGR